MGNLEWATCSPHKVLISHKSRQVWIILYMESQKVYTVLYINLHTLSFCPFVLLPFHFILSLLCSSTKDALVWVTIAPSAWLTMNLVAFDYCNCSVIESIIYCNVLSYLLRVECFVGVRFQMKLSNVIV